MKNVMDEKLLDLINKSPSDILFLCGAGISLDAPSSLPTVYHFIKNISSECEMNAKLQNKLLEQFNKINYRFESLIDEIRKKFDADLLVANLFSSSTYNQLHYFLAKMLQAGASVITTNFDTCIENAIIMNQMSYDFENRTIYSGDDYSSKKDTANSQLIKIHGSHLITNDSNSELVITISSLAKTSKAFSMLPRWKEFLLKLLYRKTVVVMGYSCSDDFDIVPLIESANPDSIMWLNYKHENLFPVLEKDIENEKVANLAIRLPLLFFNGQLRTFLTCWSENKGFSLIDGPVKEMFTVKRYVNEVYPYTEDKATLNNELLLSYGLYKEVSAIEENKLSKLQVLKAQFRSGHYSKVIKNCTELLSGTVSGSLQQEVLYYFSSALYYEKDYIKALEIAKKSCNLAKKNKDEVFYLHSLINYASILYVHASAQPESEQKLPLKEAVSIYKIVLKKSKGISIEAEANALWGLGDIERYRGNNEKAESYLQQALCILKKIGNSYAIEQLTSIIEEMK